MPLPATISKNTLYRWMNKATLEQKKAFAKAAKTSIRHLAHIAAGRRAVGAGLAQRLAAASRTLHRRDLYLDQRQLCHECAMCPLVAQPFSKTPEKVAPKRTPKAGPKRTPKTA